MRLILLLLPLIAFAENVESGKTYLVKKLKSFTPKGDEKNSVAHFILYKDERKKHVIEAFCLLPPGDDPTKSKRVTIGEKSNAPNSIEFFCDLAQ